MKPEAPDHSQLAAAADLLETLRNEGGLVHCLTNIAAAQFSADVLLAMGARPSLTYAPEEVGEFAASADALLVNLGTLDAERMSGFAKAVEIINAREKPWVLDPVLCERSAPRRKLAEELLAGRPAIVKLNARELFALTGASDAGSAAALAREHGTVVVVTGAADLITDGHKAVQFEGGHDYMDLGTAYGCAGGAVTAACAAHAAAPFAAALAGQLIFNLAGEIAGRIAGGPGSFRPIFLDTLHMLEAEDLTAYRSAIEEVSL